MSDDFAAEERTTPADRLAARLERAVYWLFVLGPLLLSIAGIIVFLIFVAVIELTS